MVRNHWVTKLNQSAAGFFDASLWEDAKKTSDLAIKRLINGGLDNTSVTCVLIGSQTFNRRWVRYEIIRSIEKGNKILGIHINGFKDKNGTVKAKLLILFIIWDINTVMKEIKYSSMSL